MRMAAGSAVFVATLLITTSVAAQRPLQARGSCSGEQGACRGGYCRCFQGFRCHVELERFCACRVDDTQQASEHICEGQRCTPSRWTPVCDNEVEQASRRSDWERLAELAIPRCMDRGEHCQYAGVAAYESYSSSPPELRDARAERALEVLRHTCEGTGLARDCGLLAMLEDSLGRSRNDAQMVQRAAERFGSACSRGDDSSCQVLWGRGALECARQGGASCDALRNATERERQRFSTIVSSAAYNACQRDSHPRCHALADALEAGNWQPLAARIRAAACASADDAQCPRPPDPAELVRACAELGGEACAPLHETAADSATFTIVVNSATEACVTRTLAHCHDLASALSDSSSALATTIRREACRHASHPECPRDDPDRHPPPRRDDPGAALFSLGLGGVLLGWIVTWVATIAWYADTSDCTWDGLLPQSCTHRGPTDDALGASFIPLVGPWIMVNTPNIDATFPVIMGIVQDLGLVLAVVGVVITVADSPTARAAVQFESLPEGGQLSLTGRF